MIPESAGGCKKVVAPSPVAFADHYPLPQALTGDGIHQVVNAFAEAARRPCEAGFRVIEIHAAHGYLIHEFLSPLNNSRSDLYGGSFENRIRMLRAVVGAIRRVWPERAPLFVRISATDWVDRGWDIQQSVGLARQLKPLGADLIDCFSGGNVPKIPAAPPGLRLLPIHCPHSALPQARCRAPTRGSGRNQWRQIQRVSSGLQASVTYHHRSFNSGDPALHNKVGHF